MRRPLTGFRTGLSVAAALVLLTACGGSKNDNSASSSSKTSSSATQTAAKAAGSEFCTKAAAVESSVSAAMVNQSDPTSIPKALQTAVTQIRAIDPPPEIAADWSKLADGVQQLATAFAGVNFTDQAAVASFEKTANDLEAQLSGASTNVEKYLKDKCGLTAPGGSSSPTS